MKKTLLALAIAGVVVFAAPRFASAQYPAVVKVPFQFIAGDRLMPAGAYRITADAEDQTLLTITPLNGNSGAVFTETVWNGSTSDKVDVQFRNFDGHYFLAHISMPGENGRDVPLTKSAAEQVLARLNLMPAERADVAK